MEAALVEEGDQLMAEALGTVLAGQKEVHSKLPKVGKRRSGSQRKHQTSPAYVRLAQEMRMALRMKEHKGGPQGGLEKQRYCKEKNLQQTVARHTASTPARKQNTFEDADSCATSSYAGAHSRG